MEQDFDISSSAELSPDLQRRLLRFSRAILYIRDLVSPGLLERFSKKWKTKEGQISVEWTSSIKEANLGRNHFVMTRSIETEEQSWHNTLSFMATDLGTVDLVNAFSRTEESSPKPGKKLPAQIDSTIKPTTLDWFEGTLQNIVDFEENAKALRE